MEYYGSDRNGDICNRDYKRLAELISERYSIKRDTADHLVTDYGVDSINVKTLITTDCGNNSEKYSFREKICGESAIYRSRDRICIRERNNENY